MLKPKGTLIGMEPHMCRQTTGYYVSSTRQHEDNVDPRCAVRCTLLMATLQPTPVCYTDQTPTLESLAPLERLSKDPTSAAH
jgi:hypothetical protein